LGEESGMIEMEIELEARGKRLEVGSWVREVAARRLNCPRRAG